MTTLISAFTSYRTLLLPLAAAALVGVPHVALGQASYLESFETAGGVSGLIAQGWIFRNQSVPNGPGTWFQSNGGEAFTPHTGNWVLSADFSSGGYVANPVRISNWAILPAVANQVAGDEMRFFAQGSIYSRQDRLQVRYSPSAGTATGTALEDVGDFTELLLDINPIERGAGWIEYAVKLPGPGRVALRYYIPGESRTLWGGYFGIDTLTIGAPPQGPYPIPEPGETVTWDASMSPIVLDGNVVIPEGGTVIVEPGVRIETHPTNNGTLVVEGNVVMNGTPKAPIELEASHVWPPLTIIRGRLELNHANIVGSVQPDIGSETFMTDCTLTAGGIDNVIVLTARQPFIRMERCTLTDCPLLLEDMWNILIDVTVNNGQVFLVRGISVCDNLVVNGREVNYLTDNAAQACYVNGISVTDVHETPLSLGAALNLGGSNFLVGPDVSLTNSQFPIVQSFGIMPGSTFEHSGNDYELIGYIPSHLSPRPYWANIGVDYCWLGRDRSGNLNIEPGVTVKMDYEPGFRGGMNCEGTPQQPITFEPLNPSIGWRGAVSFAAPIGLWPGGGSRFENCDFSGTTEGGAIADDGTVFTQNCTFHDNAVGFDSLSGVIAKTRFFNNDVGLLGDPPTLLSTTNPLSFEGNANAIYALGPIDARGNWWGHPTGPRAPQNPAGQGDVIAGDYASAVTVTPFLTSPPSDDPPPVVRLVTPEFALAGTYDDVGFFVRTGEKYIIRWSADDNAPIVSQRIVLNLPGGGSQVIATGLAGDVRSYEWTAPSLGTDQMRFPVIRVEATDSIGQVAWDDMLVAVSPLQLSGQVVSTETYIGDTYIGGEILPSFDIIGEIEYLNGLGAFIIFEADNHQLGGFGSAQYGYVDFLTPLPIISTDAARLVIGADIDGSGPTWFFAPGYFSVRHDPRLGLIPPTVQLLTPTAGQSFPAGGVVPITWDAADTDDGLYGIDLMVSYDGGFTWKTLAEHLAPDARSYDWHLPASVEIDDVRVRVVARDVRFQNSTSGHDRVFSIGGGPTCPADWDDNGIVNSTDVGEFINAWFEDQVAGSLVTDWDANGIVNSTDVSSYINSWFEDLAAGCG